MFKHINQNVTLVDWLYSKRASSKIHFRTIRERDLMEQVRVSTNQLKIYLCEKLDM